MNTKELIELRKMVEVLIGNNLNLGRKIFRFNVEPEKALELLDTIQALQAEVERLAGYLEVARQDHKDAVRLVDTANAEVDALKADAEKTKLTKIDRECLQIGKEIQRAAGDLPEFYEIEIYVERGYGGVYLRDPDAHTKVFDDTVDGLSHCIAKAIDTAIDAAKGNV